MTNRSMRFLAGALALGLSACDRPEAPESSGSDGGGGSAGPGSGGGGGAAEGRCLPGVDEGTPVRLVDPGFCVVAAYGADGSFVYTTPTWGRHGGPLSVSKGAEPGGVELVRWSPPGGADGELEATSTLVPVDLPDDAFVGGAALDAPFFGWTIVSYSKGDFSGEVVALAPTSDAEVSDVPQVAERHDAAGFFGVVALGDAEGGRLVHTGLSPLGASAAGENAVYAADTCAEPQPSLSGAGPGCAAPFEVAGWGEASGPLARDADGNVVAVLASFSTGDQEARIFPAASIARGAPPTEGTKLFSLPGYGSSLAVLAPRGGAPGLVAFQPVDAATNAPLAVVAAPFSAEGAPEGEPTPLVESAPGAEPVFVTLLTDPDNRLWVGVPDGESRTRFLVLDRVDAPEP